MFDIEPGVEASNNYNKAKEKLQKRAAEARRIGERISQTADWGGYEYTLENLRSDLEHLEKEIETIWAGNIEPWYESGEINDDEFQDLWARRAQVQEVIEEVKNRVNERGRTWMEGAKVGMNQVGSILESFATLAGLYINAKKALEA